MNDTTSSPSRLLKITAETARWLLGLLIGAWLLLALSVVVLHIWIVPRIGDYRGALEAQATRAIGVPVRIGSVSASPGGLFPTIELHDVLFLDANGQGTLKLERVVASVSPRSLWNLSFEQLYIERPELEMRRDAQGRIHIAGLEMPAEASGEGEAIDWFFAQREVLIQGGIVRWVDEMRKAEPLLLTDVSFVARNGGLRHAMRLDATPSSGWGGGRLSLLGQFRQPLLTVHRGNWRSWDGQMYADLPSIDVSRLGHYTDIDANIRQGSGALRVWADVNDGAFTGVVADLALTRVDASLGQDLPPLVLHDLTGRISGSLHEGTLAFATERLQFITNDGLRWPGGNLSFQRTQAKGQAPERGALHADRLDLGALAMIADRLPIGDANRKRIAVYQPRGLVERIDGSWQGPADALQNYQFKGRASGLAIASAQAEAQVQPQPQPQPQPQRQPQQQQQQQTPTQSPQQAQQQADAGGSPGVSGATVDFDLSQAGGSATLAIANGTLDLPGVFEEPVVPVDRLSAQLQWKLDHGAAQLQVSNLRFANVDAEGNAQASWRTSDPAVSRGGDRFPGVLDLQGQLTRADGTRVFRYLPLVIPKHTRDYVRDAVTKGTASTVDFKVRGDLHDMPFMDPKQGDFRIAAKVADVTFAYVPPSTGSATSPWPPLNGLSGELVFERAGMEVRNARGRFVGAPGIEVSRADAQIPDMSSHAPMLKVDAQARGPLGELLKVGAPLVGEVGTILADMRATGSADYKLHLDLPLASLDKSRLQASVVLADNDLQLASAAPALTQARGTLSFTEAGFSLAGVQARALGGALRIDGSGRFSGATPELDLRVQGNATADGLRAAREVDWLSRIARNVSGGTTYAGNFSVKDGASEFQLTSSLQGLGLQLPMPLTKAADDTMPLRIEKKIVLREARPGGAPPLVNDQLAFDIGKVGTVRYVRDISGREPRVLRGAIGVGLVEPETATPPERGVFANLRFARLDLGAWQSLFSQATGRPAEASAPADGADDASAYLPTIMALRAQELVVGGRTLHDVVMGGTRDGPLWRANIDAAELSGYAEYRPAQAGRLMARLARLKIAPSEATEVESLLDEQPSTLPALDIVTDEFELFGRQLGRAEINAVNRGGAGREWRLDKLAFSNPDANFNAQGSWAAQPGSEQRRTRMDFKLDITDAGALLNRLGMKDVLRRGHGRLEGSVDWTGSPFSLDHASLGGQLQIDVESGQFLKADPGIAKLLGVLSLQALPRRLTLDFRDVFSQGFAFDFLRGDAKIASGVATTNNLQMKGVNAAVLMDGSADIARETQNIRVVVVPEINAGTAALVATAINPLIGLGTFLAQAVLSKPLILAATQEFQIDGTWTDPKITRVPHRIPAEAMGAPVTPPTR